MGKVTIESTAKDTGSSSKDVSRAFHDARDAAAKEGGHGVPVDRHGDGGGLAGKIASGIGNILRGGKKED